MNPEYFDIHAHTQFPDFADDLGEVTKRANESKVGIINVGTGRDTSLQAVEMAKKYKNMWAIVGLHPTHTEGEHSESFDYEFYKALASHEKVVGIGECGIDLFRADEKSLAKQIEIFEEHIKLSLEVGKPLMFHIRNAYKESLEILRKYPGARGNVHFFAGNVEEAKMFLEQGFTLSFTGAITYKNSEQYHEVIKYAPIDMIMAETDCPYVAPVPHRGKRCEPVHVVEVYKKIAEIKNLPLEKVAEQIRENVKRVFAI